MDGDDSKQIITPHAVEYMRVQKLVRRGFIDVKCYQLPHFTTTLLLQVSVIKTTSHPKQYISKDVKIYFTPNKVILGRELVSNVVDLNAVDYNHDYGTYMLTSVHYRKHNCSIFDPGIIQSGLCFAQPLIVFYLDKK